MASATLFTLLDDIAALFDDVAVATKGAAAKTAGVVGDDIALNADQIIGVDPKRELPIVMEVAWGSLKNKGFLIPPMLGIGLVSAAVPWLLPTLLMIGGTWLCFEGAEKILHASGHKKEQKDHVEIIKNEQIDPSLAERQKIKGAIRTDFILSAEIMAITLNMAIMNGLTITGQTVTLIITGIALTVAVYGTVAAFVKLDDIGLHLASRKGDSAFARFQRASGLKAIAIMPALMKTVSTVGMIAMFAVGGELVVHGIPPLEHLFHEIAHKAHAVPLAGGLLEVIAPYGLGIMAGLVVGIVAVILTEAIAKLRALKP